MVRGEQQVQVVLRDQSVQLEPLDKPDSVVLRVSKASQDCAVKWESLAEKENQDKLDLRDCKALRGLLELLVLGETLVLRDRQAHLARQDPQEQLDPKDQQDLLEILVLSDPLVSQELSVRRVQLELLETRDHKDQTVREA